MILDMFFKIIILSSLPPSWDTFTQAYVAETRHHTTCDPFKNMNLQEFIGVIKAEAECQGLRHGNVTNTAYSTKAKNNKGKGQLLLKCITSKFKDMKANNNGKEDTNKKPKKLYCKHCKTCRHLVNNCNKWDETPYAHCDHFNHKAKDCWHKDKLKQDKGKAKSSPCKCARNKETNAVDSDSQHLAVVIEMTGDAAPSRIMFNSSEQGQNFNFENYDVTNYDGIDEHTLYYNWLADSATTLHVVNQRDVFKMFNPVNNTPITSVGGL